MRFRKWILGLFIILIILLILPPRLQFTAQPFSAIIEDQEGQLLSAQIAEDEQWRLPFIENVPSRFESCIITYEDRRFYNHLGVDILALLRAVKLNLQHGRIVSGASTIPMQLARLSYKNPRRNVVSKIREMIMATRLSIWYSKKQVLAWYASLAPFGGNVVGIGAASWRYFGKQVEQLTWAESATLAVLPNAPSLIHVNRNRDDLLQKRNGLLRQLESKEIISSLDLEAALLEPLPEKLKSLPARAPHYLEYCKSIHQNLKTSIDSELQSQVNLICRELGNEWAQNGIYNAAALVLSVETGEPLSYVGNISGTPHEGQVDMIQAHRSSGSILKPFLYAAMIDEGLMSPYQVQRDVPVYIGGFSPANYHKKFTGLIPADLALQRSLNVPAVLMLQEYGIDKFLRKLKKFGFTTATKGADHYGLSLILGGAEVTLWDLAQAYRQLVLCYNEQSDIISAGVAYHTLRTLEELKRPDEFGAWKRFDSAVPISWKTGTSYGHRDAWALGVTPDFVIATWVGNADGEGRDGIVGTTTAGKLLLSISDHVANKKRAFTPPYEEMIFAKICPNSGMLAGKNCPSPIEKEVATEVAKTTPCHYHRLFYVDTSGHRISDDCNTPTLGEWKPYFVIDPIAAQYYKSLHPNHEAFPDWHPNCQPTTDNVSMRYVYPNQGEQIYLPTDLNGLQQEVVFEVAHQNQDARLYWYLDDRYYAMTTEHHTISLYLDIGPHSVTVLDQNGTSISRSFKILP